MAGVMALPVPLRLARPPLADVHARDIAEQASLREFRAMQSTVAALKQQAEHPSRLSSNGCDYSQVKHDALAFPDAPAHDKPAIQTQRAGFSTLDE